MGTIHAEIPEQLVKRAETLVRDGWFRDEKDLFAEAIRRFLETHESELMEKHIRQDVEWGLHGED